jgi:alkylresorcinol/alkylpyrone synthase
VNTPAQIVSIATATPPNAVSAADVKEYFPKAFNLDPRRLAGVHAVIDNARIDKRHFVFPLDYTITPRPLDKTACEYKTYSIQLGSEVAEKALAGAGLRPHDIDLIITVSCTGMMIPSLDAHLIHIMGFRPNVRRLPITELGCSAGAAALSRARDYIQAFPEAKVLIVAVELPSLTLQCSDASPANLISCCLFGDGAAAAVVTGRRSTPGLAILDTQSYTLPDSLDMMGFNLRSTGLHIVLSKDLPQLIRSEIAAIAGTFLELHGLRRPDLEFFLLHPGGQKLLSFVEEQLDLTERDTASSWNVLADYGNLSSASIFYVIQDFLTRPSPQPGALGFLAAFGPGFTTEMALMQWN